MMIGMPLANASNPVEFPADLSLRGLSIRAGDQSSFPLSRSSVAQLIAITSLLILGQFPLGVKFFQELWSRPQYQFFPVAILAAGYIGWDRLRDAPSLKFNRGSTALTAGLLALAWVVLSCGLLYLRWMASVSVFITLVAVVWWVGGKNLLRILLPAGVLLIVLIPPPGHLDDPVANRLRVVAVHASSRILDFVWVPHLVSGTVIEIPGHRLLVEEACSGINSLMSVIAFSLLYGFWQRRPAGVIVGLTVAAAVFVICANVVRITLGAVLVHHWQIDILGGTSHEMLGMVLFAISLGLVISFDRLLILVFPPKTASPSAHTPWKPGHVARALATTSGGSSAGRWTWWAAAIAFAGLGIVMHVRLAHAWTTSRLADDASFALPAQLAGWERIQGEGTLAGRPETDGRKSFFWVYRHGRQSAGVALDYPFSGFHDSTICYKAAGWTVLNTVAARPTSGGQDDFYVVTMSKPPVALGQMLFGLFDESGRAPPPTPAASDKLGRLKVALLLSRQKAEALPTYQVQTLAIGVQPLSAQDQANVRALFLAARAELSRQVVVHLGGKP
jgi:exosortase